MPAKALYFDTCYLVRLYLDDRGCEEVGRLAETTDTVVSAWHAQSEVIAALHRAYREERFSHQAFLAAVDQFHVDCTNQLFQWLPLNEDVQNELEGAFRQAGSDAFLRAADALHLACAKVHGFGKVHSNDQRFLKAAKLFGLKGVDVIPK